VSKEFRLDPIKEAMAAKALRESLLVMAGDDEELIADSVEGETSLFECFDKLLASNVADTGLVAGIEQVISDLEGRKERFKKRIEVRRELITQAMSIAELPKAERPAATLSLSKRAPSLIVTDEAAIPSSYWKVGDPKLDKKGLTEALRARAQALQDVPDDPEAKAAALAALPPEIPGATLSNAAPTLTIRAK
jgi:hypothetical protein